MDYAGGPAGLTGSHVGTCPVCGWTGPGRDAPFHDCQPPDVWTLDEPGLVNEDDLCADWPAPGEGGER